MKHIYFFILFVLAFANCKEAKKDVAFLPLVRESVDTIKDSIPEKLKATEIPMEGVIDPARMKIVKNILFVACFKCEPLIYMFSLPEFQLIDSFGIKGQGPDEFLYPFFCDGTFEYLYIWGYTDIKKINKFRIHSNGCPVIQNTFSLNKSQIMNQIHLLKDSFLVYNTFPEGLSLKKIDLFDFNKIKEFHFEKDRSFAESAFQKNRGNLAASNSGIAYLYYYKDKIDFFDLNLNLRVSVENKKNNNNNINSTPQGYRDSAVFYTAQYAGEKSLYALYDKMSFNQIENVRRSCIKEFDWNGNELNTYDLDYHLELFVVKEDEKNYMDIATKTPMFF